MADNNATKVMTGKGRLSYAFIWEPKMQDDDESKGKKYSTCFLIPKSDIETIEKLKAAMNAAAVIGKAKKWGSKIPQNLKLPLRDGDKETDKPEEYRGHYFINANSVDAPGIVDRKKQAISDHEDVYSGCYARIIVNLFPYSTRGNNGIGCGLNHIQKLGDGEPLASNRGKAENEFDSYIDGDDDLPFGEDDGSVDLPFGKDDQLVA